MIDDIYKDFTVAKVNYGDDNNIFFGEDGSCIKSAVTEKGTRRLANEYNCLSKLQNLNCVPQIIAYDGISKLRMSIAKGVNLIDFVHANNYIPTYYFKSLVECFLKFIDCNVEYGGDDGKLDHIFIDDTTKKLTVIDFGISTIITDANKEHCKNYYRSSYNFVFDDGNSSDDSINALKYRLSLDGISDEIIENFITNMDFYNLET